jgi:hypothetical protein
VWRYLQSSINCGLLLLFCLTEVWRYLQSSINCGLLLLFSLTEVWRYLQNKVEYQKRNVEEDLRLAFAFGSVENKENRLLENGRDSREAPSEYKSKDLSPLFQHGLTPYEISN